MFARIDALERQKNEGPAVSEASRNLGDLNMKLKLEIGNLRAENDKLMKANHDISREKADVNDKLIQTKAGLDISRALNLDINYPNLKLKS